MIELIVAFVAGILVSALFVVVRKWTQLGQPSLETPLEITNAVRDAYHEGFLDGKLWADSSRALKKE